MVKVVPSEVTRPDSLQEQHQPPILPFPPSSQQQLQQQQQQIQVNHPIPLEPLQQHGLFTSYYQQQLQEIQENLQLPPVPPPLPQPPPPPPQQQQQLLVQANQPSSLQLLSQQQYGTEQKYNHQQQIHQQHEIQQNQKFQQQHQSDESSFLPMQSPQQQQQQQQLQQQQQPQQLQQQQQQQQLQQQQQPQQLQQQQQPLLQQKSNYVGDFSLTEQTPEQLRQQTCGQETSITNPLVANASCFPPPYPLPSTTRGGGQGGGSMPVYTPHTMRCVGAVGEGATMNVYNTYDEVYNANSKRPRLEHARPDPPVATYPDRSRLQGPPLFQVEIPGMGTKLYVAPPSHDDPAARTIITVKGRAITFSVTLPANTRPRFLLVYAKDSEASQPVHPCKNHCTEAHPKHMLEVKASETEAVVEWHEEPHPSVLVTPTPLAPGTPSAPGKYSCQLTFLCRNSCVLRKELMLLCQLEAGNKVVGREVFKVKISASPTRDSAAYFRRPPPASSALQDGKTRASSNILPLLTTQTESVAQQGAMAREAKRQARLVYLEQYFKDHCPDKHTEASTNFSQLWNSWNLSLG